MSISRDADDPKVKGRRLKRHRGQFHTARQVSALLVDAMCYVESPSIVLELGAGDGALVREAARVWRESRFVTVDIDKDAQPASFKERKACTFEHYIHDALCMSLPDRTGIGVGGADAALCNPPYIRSPWRKHFGYLLEEAGLSAVLPRIRTASTDVLFLAQNLRFVKKSGRIGLILPDGLIAGEKFAALRETLATRHCIQKVIELPRNVFRGTDAKTYVVVIAKQEEATEYIEVRGVTSGGQLTAPILVPVEQAGLGLNYSGVSLRNSESKSRRSLGDLGALVVRGRHSSAQLKLEVSPVFHTSDFRGTDSVVSQHFAARPNSLFRLKPVYAFPGDTLIPRVGRRIGASVALVRFGPVPISDSVFCIRTDPQHRAELLAYLRSSRGSVEIEAAAHGVAARFLTKTAVLSLGIEAGDVEVPRAISARHVVQKV